MPPAAGQYPPAMSTGGDNPGDYYAKLSIKNENQEAGEGNKLEEGEVTQESETIACCVCDRVFMSPHGHMRSHPARPGLGSVTPSMEEETAKLLMLLSGSSAPLHRKYLCHGCHEDFETRHALVGQGTSHEKQQGYDAQAKDSGRRRGGRSDDDEAAESSRRGRKRKNKRPLLDLNKPPSSSSPSGSNDGSGGSESSSSGDAEEEEEE